MKVSSLTLKILLFFIIILYINLNQGCKDPGEYEPGDSLIPPPTPPQLITPPDSALFSLTPGFPIDIYFQWSSIADAEFYEIEFSSDIVFNTTSKYRAYSYSATISFDQTGDFFWRVRAYSSLWIWYTSWSEIKYFKISSAR